MSSETNKNSLDTTDNKSKDEGSLALGFFIFISFGCVLLALGIFQFRKELKIYRTKLDIKTNGKYTLGVVAPGFSYSFKTSGSRIHRKTERFIHHTILYDNNECKHIIKAQLPLPEGTKLPVLFLPDEPQKIIVGNISDDMSDLRGKKISLLLSFLLGAIVYIAIIGFGAMCFIPVLLNLLGKTKRKPKNKQDDDSNGS